MGRSTRRLAKTGGEDSGLKESIPLKSDPQNVRLHPEQNQDLIRQSLEEVGPFRSIGVDGENIIRAGNGVYEQAQALGLDIRVVDAKPNELIAVRRADLVGDKARRAALYDNQTTLTSQWDESLLSRIASEEGALLEGIFSANEISSWQVGPNTRTPTGGPAVEQTLPDLRRKWKTKAGQLWAIPGSRGSHLLYLGDCRESKTSEILRRYGDCVGVFTSPPYAEQRKRAYGGVRADEYLDWWEAVQLQAKTLLVPDGSFFLNLKAHCEAGERLDYVYELVLAMKRKWNWRLVDELAWVKPGYPGDMGKRFKNGFEPIYHFAKTLDYPFYLEHVLEFRESQFGGYNENLATIQGRTGTDGSHALDEVRPSNVLHLMPDQTPNEDTGGHPARFPPALPEFFVQAFSQVGDRWLDPFAGSGTTGIVAEQQDRLSTQIEIQPEYAAAILERFEITFGTKGKIVS